MAAKKKTSTKRLTRGSDKMVFGVCSGIGDYFGFDATIIRLLWVLTTVFTGFFPGIIIYLIAALITPEK